MKTLTASFVFFTSIKAITADDCSNVPPFQAFERQTVSIQVDRYYWVKENGQKVEKTERVCETSQPLDLGVYDIRGREEEWYSCFYQEPRPALECSTTFQGKAAQISVRPAVVIRRYTPKSARDTHAHIFLLPEGISEKYFDTFVRSLSFALKKQSVIMDSVSGGRGPESGQDSFGVRLWFQ